VLEVTLNAWTLRKSCRRSLKGNFGRKFRYTSNLSFCFLKCYKYEGVHQLFFLSWGNFNNSLAEIPLSIFTMFGMVCWGVADTRNIYMVGAHKLSNPKTRTVSMLPWNSISSFRSLCLYLTHHTIMIPQSRSSLCHVLQGSGQGWKRKDSDLWTV